MFTLKQKEVFDLFYDGAICPVFIRTGHYRIKHDDEGNAEKVFLNFWGYFDSFRKFYRDQFGNINRLDYTGNSWGSWLHVRLSNLQDKCYVFYNPVNPLLFSLAENLMKHGGKQTVPRTHDILALRWYPIDLDAVLPAAYAGHPSTNGELAWTQDHREDLIIELQKFGFYNPILAMSGNGSYLIYRLDNWSVECLKYLRRLLEHLHNDDTFKKYTMHSIVDTHLQANQMMKMWGSLVRKGKQVLDVPEGKRRLYRECYIEELPSQFKPAGQDVLDLLMDRFPDPLPRSFSNNFDDNFDPEAWCYTHNVVIKKIIDYGDDTYRFILQECPFCGNGGKDEVYLLWSQNYSRPRFVCPHSSCEGLGWKQFRQMVERGHYDEN